MHFTSFIWFVASASLALSFAHGMCRDEPDGTFLPDPTSRSRFIYCMGIFEVVGTCYPGLEFDPFNRVCDVIKDNPSTKQRDPCYGQPDGTFLPDPSSTQRFFYCLRSQAISGTCGFGMEFDPILGYCDVPQKSTTRPTTQPPVNRNPCIGKQDGTFLPYADNQRMFIFCWAQEAIEGACEGNKEFDSIKGFCDFPQTTTRPAPPPTRPTTRASSPERPQRPPAPTRAQPPQPTRAPQKFRN